MDLAFGKLVKFVSAVADAVVKGAARILNFCWLYVIGTSLLAYRDPAFDSEETMLHIFARTCCGKPKHKGGSLCDVGNIEGRPHARKHKLSKEPLKNYTICNDVNHS